MSRAKQLVTDAHRTDRIKLLQTNPDKYFENKRRINFGFVASSDNRSESRSHR